MSEMPQSIFSSRTGGPLANYPHAKRVGNLLFLSGLSARQPDGTVRGANILSDGSGQCSITEQAEGILEKYHDGLHVDISNHDPSQACEEFWPRCTLDLKMSSI